MKSTSRGELGRKIVASANSALDVRAQGLEKRNEFHQHTIQRDARPDARVECCFQTKENRNCGSTEHVLIWRRVNI